MPVRGSLIPATDSEPYQAQPLRKENFLLFMGRNMTMSEFTRFRIEVQLLQKEEE